MDDVTKTDKMLSRKDGRVGYVIFNNPERHNAVSLEMWARTAEMLESFAKDDEVRVVVITGAGGKSFVSGADISKFESERSSLDATKVYNATVARGERNHLRFPQAHDRDDPRLLHRRRAGLAVCCDLRICSDNSKFGIPAAKLGLGYSYPGVKRLVDVVGPAFAKEIFFTAPPVRRRGGARDGARQPYRAGRGARGLCEELRRHDRQQCATHREGRQVHRQRGHARTRASATSRAAPSWSRPASRATTTPKAAAPSWRSASPPSRGLILPLAMVRRS